MSEIASYSLSIWQPKPQPAPTLVGRSDGFGGLENKQVVHRPIVTAGPNAVKMKRGHVSKACTNCRKMHAGCDIQRPCSRCVFHRMESSCVDIPRKKRISRSTQPGEDSPDDSPVDVTTAVLVESKEPSAPSDKVWKDTFTELFGEVSANATSTPSLPATPATTSTTPFFQQQALFTDLLTTDTDANKPFQTPTTDFLYSDSYLFESPKKDYQEVKLQMEDLRRSNVLLEDRLNNVTQELTEMRQKMQQMLHLLGGFFAQFPQGSSK